MLSKQTIFGTTRDRSSVLRAILILMVAVFAFRLFYLQVIQHGDYVKKAEAEQVRPLVLKASRGLIYGLDGEDLVPFAVNQTLYTLYVDPVNVTNKQKVLDVVRRVAGGNLQPHVDSLITRTDTRYQILGKKLTRRQAEMIKEQRLMGVGFQEEIERVYPEGGLAAQTLGFVNNENIGQYGIEGRFNSDLTGTNGLLKSVTDVSGVPLTIGDRNINKPAQNGRNIALTIDRNIQAYTEKALAEGLKKAGATNGSVIVIDPNNGKVRAMANLPSYNPSEFYKVKDAADFNNNIVSHPYEPGSDIKTFTVAIGLDKGVIEPDSTYNNTDYIKVADRTIQNYTKGQLGQITYQTALNFSLNTGMVTIAQLLGDGKNITKGARETMYDYFHNKFGFGKITGIEVSNERPGTVIAPDQQDGGAVRYSNMTFGQGMDLTMVQVAAAFNVLVNGGTYYYPTVIEGSVSDDGVLTKAQPKGAIPNVISSNTSSKIHDMIHKARGAVFSALDKPGYDIGGKTGTSQTLINGSYENNQTIGTYLGYGGDTQARYVIMVEVSAAGKNLEGGLHAQPIFTNVSNWLIDYLKLQPKG